MIENNYPLEHFIKLKNDLYREGRITVTKLESSFAVEVDIVQVENRKIWKHVGQYFSQPSEKEAIEEGIQRLVEYIDSFKK